MNVSTRSPPEALVYALWETPDDLEAWTVLGDWLSSADDARGQIIAHEAALLRAGDDRERKAAIEVLVDANWHDWFNEPLQSTMLREHSELVLSLKLLHGFVCEARIGRTYGWKGAPVLSLLDGLLADNAHYFLRKLTLGMMGDSGENHYHEAIESLAREPRPAMQEVVLGDCARDDTEISWTYVGDLCAVLGACPNLRRLKARGGGIDWSAGGHERLEALVLESGGLGARSAAALARAAFPRLQTLEVWFGDPTYGGDATVEALDALWDGKNLPALRELRLRNAAFADDIATALVTAPIARQVEVIDLSMGTLTDAGALALAQGPLSHLKRLCVADNYIQSTGLAALKRAFAVRVDAAHQRDPDGDVRYVSVGE